MNSSSPASVSAAPLVPGTTDGAVPPVPRDERPEGAASPHLALALLALAMGGFAIGTTEFVSMGLLPDMARGVDVSIPSAGHAISAYALGVVIGAPTVAILGARWPRRALAMGLMALFVLGSVMTAFVSSYEGLLFARFVSGLPHGAFFGVASIIAAHLAARGREGRAVAIVMLGLSVANLLGVPAATWMGQTLGWRSAFWVVAGLGLLTLLLVALFVPAAPGNANASWRTEMRVLKDRLVLLTLLGAAVGFGGMFAVYTYIVPTLTEVGGLEESSAPIFLLVFGLGMVIGTWLAGELSAWSVFGSIFVGAGGQGVSLLLFGLAAPTGWWTLPLVFAITTFGSVLVVNLQVRLMAIAGQAETLGAAMNHAALNVANALGAWLGGIVVALGWGFRSPSFVGAGLAALGLLILFSTYRLERSARPVA